MHCVVLILVFLSASAFASVTESERHELRTVLDSLPLYTTPGQRIILPDNFEEIEKLLADSLGGPGTVQASDVLRLANAHFYSFNYDTAGYYFETARRLAEEQLDSLTLGWSLCGTSVVEIAKARDLAGAETDLLNAMRIFESIGEQEGLAVTVNNLGLLRLGQGNNDSARVYFEEAIVLGRASGNIFGEGLAQMNLGLICLNQGDIGQAEACFRTALSLHESTGYSEGIADALGHLGTVNQVANKSDSALAYHQRALQIHSAIRDRYGENEDLNNIKQIYQLQGDFDRALDPLRRILAMQREASDSEGAYATLSEMALTFSRAGRKDSAIYYYSEAVLLGVTEDNKVWQASSYGMIGTYYWEAGLPGEAEEPFTQAAILCRDIGDSAMEAQALMSLGAVKALQELYVAGLVDLTRALGIYQELGDLVGQAGTTRLIGMAHDASGHRVQAVEFFSKARALHLEIGDRSAEAEILYRLGVCHSLTGASEEAVDCYRESASIAGQIGDPVCESASLNQLGSTLAARGLYTEAQGHLERAMEIMVEHDIEKDRECLAETIEIVKYELSVKNK